MYYFKIFWINNASEEGYCQLDSIGTKPRTLLDHSKLEVIQDDSELSSDNVRKYPSPPPTLIESTFLREKLRVGPLRGTILLHR